MNKELSKLIGKTIITIGGGEVGNDIMVLHFNDGATCKFYHFQKCCESVYIGDVIGDYNDLIGVELLNIEEAINPDDINADENIDNTYTFYKFATIKGYVDVRWIGESNGYYSESVDIKITEGEK